MVRKLVYLALENYCKSKNSSSLRSVGILSPVDTWPKFSLCVYWIKIDNFTNSSGHIPLQKPNDAMDLQAVP